MSVGIPSPRGSWAAAVRFSWGLRGFVMFACLSSQHTVPASRSLAVERRTGVASAGPCWWCSCCSAIAVPRWACRQRKANATAGNAGQLALIPSFDPLCWCSGAGERGGQCHWALMWAAQLVFGGVICGADVRCRRFGSTQCDSGCHGSRRRPLVGPLDPPGSASAHVLARRPPAQAVRSSADPTGFHRLTIDRRDRNGLVNAGT